MTTIKRLTQGILVFSIAAFAAAQTPLTSTFTYQGRLADEGGPANGPHDFQFTLWRDATSQNNGDQIGAPVNANDISVADGIFTTPINGGGFGPNFLNGDRRWLEVRVRPGASNDAYTPLTPRQELTIAPHAGYSRLAPWSGLLGLPAGFADGVDNIGGLTLPFAGTGNSAGSLLTINNTFAGAGDPKAIHGIIDSGTFTIGDDYPAAVFGQNNDTNSLGFGVWGKSQTGKGVYGQAIAGDGVEGRCMTGTGTGVRGVTEGSGDGVIGDARGAGTGVYGVSASGDGVQGSASSGRGVYGESSGASGRGVFGAATHSTGGSVGVWGNSVSSSGRGVVGANDATTGAGIGVLGDSDSPSGIGVRGDGGTGVYGQGSTYGVRGHASTAGAYAGYFARELISNANALGTFGEVHMIGGSVGIGTNNPERTLHVAGDAILIERPSNSPGVLLRNTVNGTLDATFGLTNTASNAGYVYITDEANAGVIYVRNNSVGINASAPATPLHVGSGSDVTPTSGGYLMMGSLSATNIVMDNNEIMARDNGAVADLTLNVGGVTRVSVLEITGADLAEKFPATEVCQPGMVVAIDPANPGKLCLSRRAHNRAVAGVISGANNFQVGAVLGNLPGNEDAPAVALSGRVYVWCDACEHAIEPADLLTTSNTPGHAAKVVNFAEAQGAVLGKAMTGLKRGEKGLVLVLVSLQ